VAGLAVTFSGPHQAEIGEIEDESVGPDDVRLRTLFSGISSGTELTAYRGSNPYLHKRWDGDRRLFVSDPGHEEIAYPVKAWGYEEVGEIVDVGSNVDDLRPGTIVYGTWGHRSTKVVTAEYARQRVLPPHVDPVLGIFSQIGAIALNGVLDGAIRLGETVAVFGLGVVGQLVAQLAALSGADVIGIDLLPLRRDTAREMGMKTVIDARENAPAEVIKQLTEGRGADIAIEASGAAPALHEAIRSVAYSARVVALGFFQGQPSGLFLGEEFHHNRVNLVCSQIGGVAPDLTYRWNSERLVRTFMQLVARDALSLHPLITHMVPAAQAADLFKLLDEQPDQALQTVLDFREDTTQHIPRSCSESRALLHGRSE
jgi:2-desacetyl-2-hydroxyethyl bacteriochlorophyllide A dehydrogenase